jgi:hypothetical protein
MNKLHFYKWLIFGLLISNLILLGFWLYKPSYFNRSTSPRAKVIATLSFDSKQINAYDQLIKEHRKSIHTIDLQIRRFKHQLYAHLLDASANTNSIDSLIREINHCQYKIEQIHYVHFVAIKKLCRPDQLDEFQVLSNQIGRIFAPHPPKK